MPQNESIKRALVVAAHPDDADFGCAGTAYLWGQNGWEFYYLICTDGSKGSEDPAYTPERLAAVRRDEQRAAAAVLGVKDVFFLNHVDGELAYSRALVRDIAAYIRRLRPDAVFTHDPTVIFHVNRFVNHSDHRNAGLVAVDAVYPTARDRLNFPELLEQGLEPHKVGSIYLWGSNEPNFDVDITDVAERKFQALMEHKSQFAHREGIGEAWWKRWRNEEGRFVERFRLVQMMF